MTIYDVIRRDQEAGSPGPWVAEDWHGVGIESCRYENGAFAIFSVDCHDHMVADASCNHTCRLDRECEANAHRIARVPELEQIALDHEAQAQELERLRKKVAAAEELAASLTGMVDLWVQMANSGDCGNWDAEDDEEVIASRAALAAYREASQ